ncbi:MAG: alpha/beta hydrolase [Velocimicrobium sp.]
MIKRKLKINNIPSVLWGEQSDNLFLAIHGNMSNKEDDIITIFSENAIKHGYQVLSFDLPKHGDRKQEKLLCNVQNCIQNLEDIMAYAKSFYKHINLFACSIGSYFSLISYSNENLEQVLFLSPIVDMERLITNMMTWFGVTEEQLKTEQEIDTPTGQKLYWDYFSYVKNHPLNKWTAHTAILYGSNDDLCEFEVISNFAKHNSCDLQILEQGEHYFHTPEQLSYFKKWIDQKINF